MLERFRREIYKCLPLNKNISACLCNVNNSGVAWESLTGRDDSKPRLLSTAARLTKPASPARLSKSGRNPTPARLSRPARNPKPAWLSEPAWFERWLAKPAPIGKFSLLPWWPGRPSSRISCPPLELMWSMARAECQNVNGSRQCYE